MEILQQGHLVLEAPHAAMVTGSIRRIEEERDEDGDSSESSETSTDIPSEERNEEGDHNFSEDEDMTVQWSLEDTYT
jgi:hypothetical protein